MPAKKSSLVKKRRASSAPSKRVTYKGHGAYTYSNPGPYGRAGRVAGRAFGAAVGTRWGMPNLGAEVGERLGGLIHYPARWLGSGNYQLAPHHETGGRAIAPMPPKFTNKGEYVEICHREYICDIISSSVAGNFRIDNFPLQPGSSQTFPWLSNVVASNFQTYKFDGCIFSFESRSADALNSVNTALGTVVAAINYDSSDAVYTTRSEMENTDWSHSAAPSDSFIVPVECETKQTALGGLLYVRHAAVPSGADIKTYDLGRLSVASIGCQGTSVNLGSLYVTYKVRLYKPIILRPLSEAYYYHVRLTAASASAQLGTSRTSVFNNFNVSATNTVVTLDRTYLRENMRFVVSYVITGTGATCVTPDTALVGAQGVGIYNNAGFAYAAVGNTTAMNLTLVIQITQAGTLANPTITFSNGTYPTSFESGDLIIWQVNSPNAS